MEKDLPQMHYTTFTSDLKDRLLQSVDTYKIELALERLTQTGNVHDYDAQFESLRLLLPPNCRSEYSLINSYTRGLKGYIRKELRLRGPITIHDAKEMAYRAEMIDDMDFPYFNGSSQRILHNADPDAMEIDAIYSRRTRNQRLGVRPKYSNDDNNEWKKKLQIICSRHRLCFNCGEPGHFPRMCPLKYRSKANPTKNASSP
ncbi:uncharacterized protein SKDI_07G2050 [Saccharomyces kudriavzevii IFO 1802]|uniref:CCHC-type domain-containing protein n=1 Tax=Saccharomyces kudriavzevii (strain ATCC MYA-4449 / AS 2.2408 / CBS 8840 / NBRC 1802 / NCYC 2889) TaxID=226230 RepID=A0AA35NQG8_SACK1|nr:uncharacterized protein SKDI_07G2050 [Saccharomyces kudriavzevii IFO 1802]CAI4061860.1 hypothetical protein SKDI_07G2050 [Saccharomyces kudriavzevii IFO 1802]